LTRSLPLPVLYRVATCVRVDRARQLHLTFDSINQVAKHALRASGPTICLAAPAINSFAQNAFSRSVHVYLFGNLAGMSLNCLLGPSCIRSDVELPPNSALTSRVLMVVLWRKWIALIRCDFPLATQASINSGHRNRIARTVLITPPVLVSIAFDQHRTIYVPRH